MAIKWVTKADGTKAKFDKNKIIFTATRAGATPDQAAKVANIIESEAEDLSSTHMIYEMVFNELKKISQKYASKFSLREAIADLDSGSFELFTKAILEACGWSCTWREIIKGKAVEHDIDVVATKNNPKTSNDTTNNTESWLVECKRHFNPHRWCGLDVVLEVQARLEDLRDGYVNGLHRYNFKGAWIWTNTKFSDHAKTYASAKNIRLTGWHSGEFGLERLIEEKKVFPVTILNIDVMPKSKLLATKIVTVQDVLTAKRPVSMPEWPEVVKQAKELLK